MPVLRIVPRGVLNRRISGRQDERVMRNGGMPAQEGFVASCFLLRKPIFHRLKNQFVFRTTGAVSLSGGQTWNGKRLTDEAR